ncbi:hypothetical protein F5Y15DRAFT_271972 [Xylariaceae sp. FL0016]|nr:hypothetical protein F5Y15DRAFT_271972 [Xylariaceae sp. FL0016]
MCYITLTFAECPGCQGTLASPEFCQQWCRPAAAVRTFGLCDSVYGRKLPCPAVRYQLDNSEVCISCMPEFTSAEKNWEISPLIIKEALARRDAEKNPSRIYHDGKGHETMDPSATSHIGEPGPSKKNRNTNSRASRKEQRASSLPNMMSIDNVLCWTHGKRGCDQCIVRRSKPSTRNSTQVSASTVATGYADPHEGSVRSFRDHDGDVSNEIDGRGHKGPIDRIGEEAGGVGSRKRQRVRFNDNPGDDDGETTVEDRQCPPVVVTDVNGKYQKQNDGGCMDTVDSDCHDQVGAGNSVLDKGKSAEISGSKFSEPPKSYHAKELAAVVDAEAGRSMSGMARDEAAITNNQSGASPEDIDSDENDAQMDSVVESVNSDTDVSMPDLQSPSEASAPRTRSGRVHEGRSKRGRAPGRGHGL